MHILTSSTQNIKSSGLELKDDFSPESNCEGVSLLQGHNAIKTATAPQLLSLTIC